MLQNPPRIGAAVAAGLCLSAVAVAAEPVVVTATRTAQTAAATLAPVTVITRQDIARSTAQDLGELLRKIPGVDVSSSGGFGKATSIFMRGTNSDHVLTLVDGVKLYSATLGTTAFQFIPLDQIERIEVVRGPRASLYGSEAIGGVIQIFTRKGGDRTATHASAGYGGYNSVEGAAGVSGPAGAGHYSVEASGFDTRGYNVRQDAQPDRDGYNNVSGSARYSRELSATAGYDLSVWRAEGTTDFDNSFDPPGARNQDDFVQQVSQASAHFAPNDIWAIKLQAGQSRDDSDVTRDGIPNGRFDTKHNQLSWQNDFQVGEVGLATAGVDYSDDRVSSGADFPVDSRTNTGLFAQWQGDYGRHSVVTSVRYDDNEQFGSKTTGTFDYGFDITDALRLTLGAGTAFKAPSFNQLYYPGFGNPDLKPEDSASYEIGLAGAAGGGRWALHAFETDVDDLIVTDLTTFTPANINRARIRGVEAEYTVTVAGWDLSANLTYLDPRNQDTDKLLRRRARRTATVSAERDFGRWRAGASVLAQDGRYEDAANTVKLAGYEVVSVRLGYDLSANLALELEGTNLFDDQHETADGFSGKGRSWFLRLKYHH